MKKFIKNKRLFIIVLLSIILISAGMFVLLKLYITPKYNVKDMLNKKENEKFQAYVIRNGEKKNLIWKDLFYFEGETKENETVYMSINIDELTEELKQSGMGTPILQVVLQDCKGTIFLDNQVIYTDDSSADNRIGYVNFSFGEYSPSSRTVYLSLPEDYKGKILTIAFASSFYMEGDGVWTPLIWASDIAGYLGEQVAIGGGQIYKISIYTMLIVIVMIILVYGAYRGKFMGSLVVLGLYFFTCILKITLSNPNAVGYYCKGMINNEIVMIFTTSASGFLLLLYIVLQAKIWKIPLRIFYVISTIIYSVLYYFIYKEIQVEVLLKWLDFVLFALIIVIFINIFIEWKKGSFYHKVFGKLIQITLIVLFGLYVISIYNNDELYKYINGIFVSIKEYGFTFLNYNIIMILAIICFITIVITQIRNIIIERIDYQLLKSRGKMEEESYIQMKEYVTETYVLKHDIKKHINIISQLLNEGEYNKAKNYSNQLTVQVENITPVIQTNNKILDNIFNSRINKASSKNIKIELLNLSVLKNINMEEIDICSLFTNVIDNAIEACEKLNDNNKKISIYLNEKNNFIYFSCENYLNNSILKKNGNDFKSTKAKSLDHGYGLTIVKKIAEKYQGFMVINTENNTFKIEVAIKNN